MTISHPPVIVAGVIALVSVALWTDVRRRLIPNVLTLPAIAAGLLINALGDGWLGAALSGIGLVVGGLLFLLPFALGKMGGGDVKLMAAIGAWVGPLAIISVALYSAVAGGILAIIITVGQDRLREILGRTWLLAKWAVPFRSRAEGSAPVESGMGMPYGVAIAAGALFYLAIGGVI